MMLPLPDSYVLERYGLHIWAGEAREATGRSVQHVSRSPLARADANVSMSLPVQTVDVALVQYCSGVESRQRGVLVALALPPAEDVPLPPTIRHVSCQE